MTELHFLERKAKSYRNRNRYSGIQRCEQGNCNFVQSSERLEEYSCKRYSRKRNFMLRVIWIITLNVVIFAYKWLVYGGKCEDMLFVSIRTGARVIPIINNQPVRGTCGYSGELGHVKVSGGSRICSCGRYGCLNSEISDVAIVNKIIDGIKVGRFREIAEAVQGDMDKVTMMSFIKFCPGRTCGFVKTSGSGQRIHSRYIKYAGKYFCTKKDSFVWGTGRTGGYTFGWCKRKSQ